MNSQPELGCAVSVPFGLPSIVAVSGTPQTTNPVFCETTLNAQVALALPCATVGSALKKLLAVIDVAVLPAGGAGEEVGEEVGNELGVLVVLGEGEGLTVAVLLTALEAVEVVETDVFSVELMGALF